MPEDEAIPQNPLPDENPDQETEGEPELVGSGRVWPLRNEAEARRVADHYSSLKTPPPQRRRLQERIMMSPDFIPLIAPLIIEALLRAEIETKHAFLDLFLQAVAKGKDLSVIAEHLSKIMIDPNFGLREKAAALLIRMGPAANGAALRAVGMLRSKMIDVQANSLRLLGAIGPICAKMALPKIEMMLKGSLDKEVLVEARETIRILRGEGSSESEKPRSGPALREPAVKSDPVASAVSAARKQYPNIQDRCILVVDDDEGIRRMVVNALSCHGAQVLEAADGKEALELLKSGRKVDLLMTDLLMPQMNGAEMLRTLREDKALEKLPVYVISARTERTLLLAMAKLGVAGYFMKPFKLQEILERINATFSS